MTPQEQLKQNDKFTENNKIITDYNLSQKEDILQISIKSLRLKTVTSTYAIIR